MSGIGKVLVFDIWGDYAHFRRFETTTSPLTFYIPTRTALAGIIAAIIGLKRDSYYDYFKPENSKIGIKILKPLSKVRININLIKTDDGFFLWDNEDNPHSPTPYEFVKTPSYRIYVRLECNELQTKLKENIREHQCYYTPYLGISGLIANFQYIGEFDSYEHTVGNDVSIDSVTRNTKVSVKLEVDDYRTYVIEKIPVYMNKDRVVQEYTDVRFEVNGNPLIIKEGSYYRIGEENVTFI